MSPARGWELVASDATDAEAMRRLASRTAVLASTVGPYARYGRDVVRAAAEEGTDYADLTGEILFVRWALHEVDRRARETGARIVHSCGFDSIPSDLGVLLTAQRATADGQGTLEETRLVVRELKGGISGGTVDSARQQAIAVHADPALRRLLQDPYALSVLRTGEPDSSADRPAGRTPLPNRLPVERDPVTGHWLGPFVMSDYNTALVELSNALAAETYGRGFRYKEFSDFGHTPLGPVRALTMSMALAALGRGLSWSPTRAVLDRLLPKPGEGPTAERRAAGRFRMEIIARTRTGARYRTTVAAPHDPGYDGTAIMLGESALCLALDQPGTPRSCGVLTPATALGNALVERLRRNGFVFEVERFA
ncbi:MAG: saccharopine dehydrogenase family protein [Actinomycetes bacterium]